MKDPIQEEIIEEFSVFDEWLDKYFFLIELTDSVPPIVSELRTDEYAI